MAKFVSKMALLCKVFPINKHELAHYTLIIKLETFSIDCCLLSSKNAYYDMTTELSLTFALSDYNRLVALWFINFIICGR